MNYTGYIMLPCQKKTIMNKACIMPSSGIRPKVYFLHYHLPAAISLESSLAYDMALLNEHT